MAIQLSGSLAITGSLVATSQIIAQTLNVQQVTSSIVYSSGSNIFGNSLSNTQIMTGSVSITGSLSVNGISSTLGTGTTNYLPKFTGASTIGDSIVQETSNGIEIASINYRGVTLKTSTISDRPTLTFLNTGANNSSYIQGVGRAIAFGNLNSDFGGHTETMRLDASGNLGLGFTPSASGTNTRALQLTNYGTVSGNGNIGSISLAANAYESADNSWNRVNATSAGLYQISYTGQHSWYYTGASTAGSAISFTQAMTLNASGNLSIGNTNNTFKLDVSGTGRFTERLQVRGGGAGTSQGGILIDYVGNANSRSWILNNDYNVFGDFAILQSTTQTGSTYTAPFYIKNDGNVGIGTTSPATALHVYNSSQGVARFESTQGEVNIALNNSSASGNLIGTIGAAFYFYSGGSERMRITSGGNVGIGTTSPANILHLLGGDSSNSTLKIQASTYPMIDFISNDADSGNRNWRIASVYNAYGTFEILSSTTAGGTPLTTRFSINAITGVATFSGSVKSSGLVVLGSNSSTTPYALGSSAPRFQLMNGGVYGLAGDVLTNGNTYLQSQQTDGNTTAYNLLLQPLGGNVGIGTTSPSARLSLGSATNGERITWANTSNIFSEYSSGDLWLSSNFYGNLGTGGYVTSVTATFGAAGINVSATGGGLNGVIKFFVDNAASKTAGASFTPTERMRITGGGSVGIGTTSMDTKLHVFDGSAGTISSYESTGITIENSGRASLQFLSPVANDAYVFFGSPNSANAGYVGYENTANRLIARSSGYISLVDGTGEIIRITGGNVGIGTTSPNFKLSVSDNSNYVRTNQSGAGSPTVEWNDKSRFRITNGSAAYRGIRTNSLGYKYVRIEADLRNQSSVGTDHFGFFWGANQDDLGINTGVSGYKWVWQNSVSYINLRDISTNTNIASSSTLPFAYNDGVWHHWVLEVRPEGIYISVDGVVILTAADIYSIGGYCGLLIYNTGYLDVANFNITSLSDQYTQIYTSTSQLSGFPAGYYYFKNSSGQVQQLYYDNGYILVASNNASDDTLPKGTGRNSTAYRVNRNGAMGHLGFPSPDRDYLIGGWVDNFTFSGGKIVAFGRSSTNGSTSWNNLGTYITATWNASSFVGATAAASVTIGGNSTLDANAAYFTLDAVRNDTALDANTNQSTIGGAGTQGSGGDPSSGCYLGHGTSEGTIGCEGWYDSSTNAADCQGYTTWIKT
jgi:hypothetical protein